MCPPGTPYMERTVLYDDFEDSRECSECSCGDPEGLCTGNIFGTSNSSCSLLLNQQSTDGENSVCLVDSNNVTDFVAARVDVDPQATCEPGGGVLSGEATEIDPRTLCCTP